MNQAFTVEDATTGSLLLTVPSEAYASAHVAHCTAARQARRFAVAGKVVVLRGGSRNLRYEGDQVHVPCTNCGAWHRPRRRTEKCLTCAPIKSGRKPKRS